MRRLALATAAALLLCGPAAAQVNEIKEAIAQLTPLTAGGDTDTAVYVWGDGSVNVSVRFRDGVQLLGRGGDLKTALADLARRMESSSTTTRSGAEVVKAIINRGTSSQ